MVADCRFANELHMLKQFPNSQIIYIQRNEPNWFGQFRSGDDYVINLDSFHPSEIEWMRFTFDNTINNDATIEQLHSIIFNLFE